MRCASQTHMIRCPFFPLKDSLLSLLRCPLSLRFFPHSNRENISTRFIPPHAIQPRSPSVISIPLTRVSAPAPYTLPNHGLRVPSSASCCLSASIDSIRRMRSYWVELRHMLPLSLIPRRLQLDPERHRMRCASRDEYCLSSSHMPQTRRKLLQSC